MQIPTEAQCRKFLTYTFAALCLGALVLFAGWVLFSVLLPFVLAWGTAFCVQPMVRTLHRRTKLPNRFLGVVFALIVLAALGVLAVLLVNRLFRELQGLCAYLVAHQGDLMTRIAATLAKVQDKLPILKYFGEVDPEALRRFLLSKLSTQLTALTDRIPAFLSRSMRLIPELFLFSAVLIMAVFCFCGDFSRINGSLLGRLSEPMQLRLQRVKQQFLSCGRKMLRAYLILFVITFAELLIGLLLLRIPYAFALAFLIACLDFLPVFGVGTVLIPWGIWSLLLGDRFWGWGLLILYLIITLIRQILEPRIVGESIGVSSILTLIALYAGYRLGGILGMLLFPLAVVLLRSLLPPKQAKAGVS